MRQQAPCWWTGSTSSSRSGLVTQNLFTNQLVSFFKLTNPNLSQEDLKSLEKPWLWLLSPHLALQRDFLSVFTECLLSLTPSKSLCSTAGSVCSCLLVSRFLCCYLLHLILFFSPFNSLTDKVSSVKIPREQHSGFLAVQIHSSNKLVILAESFNKMGVSLA